LFSASPSTSPIKIRILAFITPLSPLIPKRGILSIVILPLNIPLRIRGIKGVMNVPELPL
jgi:ABC-type transport system involved in cytochrome c biogenesis permease component